MIYLVQLLIKEEKLFIRFADVKDSGDRNSGHGEWLAVI
jgi:hypothetical protein